MDPFGANWEILNKDHFNVTILCDEKRHGLWVIFYWQSARIIILTLPWIKLMKGLETAHMSASFTELWNRWGLYSPPASPRHSTSNRLWNSPHIVLYFRSSIWSWTLKDFYRCPIAFPPCIFRSQFYPNDLVWACKTLSLLLCNQIGEPLLCGQVLWPGDHESLASLW